MAATLIQTKFHPPRVHGRLVARERLSEQIRQGARAALTLVSAPAGFGKTTLLVEVAAGAAHAANAAHAAPVAWLSLEPTDNDPVTFWSYVMAALDRAAPGAGRAGSQLDASGGSIEAALAMLVNDLATLETDVVLVLDDLHVVDDAGIHRQLTFLLDHLPPNAHVMVGTRSDPPMPLARLRARGALVELRAADLRFTEAEAGTYLRAAMGLRLSDADVATLGARTEGWIAALQLAGLSMQGRADPGDFIHRFAGDDRYIVDYLVEEVLARQPESIREFLLQTSILRRMTGPLADAVTGGAGGRATLDALDRGNLFVVALDDRRRWYRYHHLFADVLQAHLRDESPDLVPVLHERASAWYREHGDRPAAIEHAIAAGAFERAADLIEPEIAEIRRHRQDATLRRWIELLPDELVGTRPVLALGFAGGLMRVESFEQVEPLLQIAERLLDDPAPARGADRHARATRVVVDEAEFRRAPGVIAMYRAAMALARGDVVGAMDHARQVLERTADDDIGRGGAEALMGLAQWTLGDLDIAFESYARGMASLERAGYFTDVVGGAIAMADLRLGQGRLREARAIYERGLDAARAHGQPALQGVADMHVGLGDVDYERDDLASAAAHLVTAEELGEEYGFPRFPYRSRVGRARILQARGNLDGALELLDAAERLYRTDYSPPIQPVAAIRARFEVAHGRLASARAWARTVSLDVPDDEAYLHEYAHITVARLRAAEAAAAGRDVDAADAVTLAGRLLVAAEASGRGGSVLDARIAHALALQAAGDVDAAIESLEHAVQLAAPEGYVRVFQDAGPAMTALLRTASRRPSAPAYLQQLLDAGGPTGPRARSAPGLVEQLSERELDVLRLLRSELDGPGMARELVVSLNTLRTHTKNIYAKLGVSSRRAAVRRAAELGLLSPPAEPDRHG